MANAGRHNDTRLLKQMIREGRLLKIHPDDKVVITKIKIRFNDLVINDYTSNYSYLNKTYKGHSAWTRLNNTLIWANQLRVKYWCFDTISL